MPISWGLISLARTHMVGFTRPAAYLWRMKMEVKLWVKSVKYGVKEAEVSFNPEGGFMDTPYLFGRGALHLRCSKEDAVKFEPGMVYRVEITATGVKASEPF